MAVKTLVPTGTTGSDPPETPSVKVPYNVGGAPLRLSMSVTVPVGSAVVEAAGVTVAAAAAAAGGAGVTVTEKFIDCPKTAVCGSIDSVVVVAVCVKLVEALGLRFAAAARTVCGAEVPDVPWATTVIEGPETGALAAFTWALGPG